MATEKPNLPAPEEQVSPVAEDVQAAPETAADAVQPELSAPAETQADPAQPRPKRARIKPVAEPVETEADEDEAPANVEVDFSDEDAALAARSAGLELDEATAEEDAAERAAGEESSEDRFAGKSKEELVGLFARMLEEQPVQSIRRDVEALKIAFYRLRRAEVEAARRRFVEEGGAEEDFTPAVDGVETQLKELFREYRRRRDEFIANLEAEKERNLKIKLEIIEELKELVNSDETLNHTFTKFRELQQRWKETGIVPQQQVKDLWETYNLHVENFYNFIKINKELRDLDLKKNYEQKVALCEQAEALLLEPSIVEAFHKLQKLHDEWRETGPVANEYKEALWERFKAASSRINKQHQEHFEALKAEQVKNLGLKTELCVATEELAAQPLTTRKEWNRASDRLLEIQKTWKTIGFAPKKDNNRIYERFRTACDRFFEAKRQFYAGVKRGVEEGHRRTDRPAGPLEADRGRGAPPFGCRVEAFPCGLRQVLRAQERPLRQCGRRARGEPAPQAGPARRDGGSRREGGRLRGNPRLPAPLGRDRLRAHQAEGRRAEALQGRRRCALLRVARFGARPLDGPLPREGLHAQGVGRPAAAFGA